MKATVFLIGELVERYPKIVRRIFDEGQEIGNHTYSHPKDLPKMDLNSICEEIENCASAIEKVTGTHPTLFRPPRGYLNYRVHTAAQLFGYKVIFWTVSADHRDAQTPEEMKNRVLKLVHPGAIILMHDGRVKGRYKDVQALPSIIEGLQRLDYSIFTVSNLLKVCKMDRYLVTKTSP